MARAGYCSECKTNVWLTDAGCCANGHPAESVSGHYDSEVPAVPPVAEAAARPKTTGRRIAFIVAGLVVGVLALCVAAGALVRPLVGQGAVMADEWKTRLAEDYPGWRSVGFNFRTFSGGEGSRTEYSFAMIPPDRDFSVSVMYVSEGGARAESMDEVFRAEGAYHDRADSLLDHIETNYVKAGKAVSSVASEADGTVIVSWVKESRVGIFSSRVGSFDELEYDETSGSWTVTFSPRN